MATLYWILGLIVTAIVGFGGGWIASDAVDMRKPPKTLVQNISQVQNTENNNTSIQSSEQAQITTTVITGKTNMSLSVNYNGRTNFSHSLSSKTNRSSKTN